jgi:hypothetical protein
MKKVLTVCNFLLCLSSAILAQTLDASYQGCNSFRVDFTGNITQNLFTAGSTVNCSGITRRLAFASIPGAQYRLQQKD